MSRLPILALMFAASAFAQVSVNGVPNQTVGGISGPNGLGISLINLGDATVSQLSTLATTNSILGVGTVLVVSDAAAAGDVTTGGGTVRELVQCASISGTTCSNWVALSGGGGGTTIPNLVYRWLMNDASGTTFASDYGSAPMTTTDITWGAVSGFLGSAANFNGTSSSAHTAGAVTSLDAQQPFTLSVWVSVAAFPTAGNSMELFNNVNAAAGYQGIALSFGSDGSITAQLIGSTGSIQETTASSALGSGIHHIVLTVDGTSSASGVKAYVDGTAKTFSLVSANDLSSSTASSTVLGLGYQPTDGGGTYSGVLADARIYNVALSPSQVSLLYSAGVQ